MTFSELTALILAIFLCSVVLFGGYSFWRTKIRSFIKKRNHILTRIKYAKNTDELRYWKHELTKNWQERIPIIGKYIYKK